MKDISSNYINQYKNLFYITWGVLYFLFPSWRFSDIYVSFANSYINIPAGARIPLFLIYFFISAGLLHFCLKPVFVDKPLAAAFAGIWASHVKNRLWIASVCGLAVLLHLLNIPRHIISPHTVTDRMSLWLYRFVDLHWQKLAGFPVQYLIWASVFILILILKQKKLVDFISSELRSLYALCKSNHYMKLLFIACIGSVFFAYVKLVPYYSLSDHFFITGEAPLGTVLYLTLYFLLGTGIPALVPLITQLAFYALSGFFLYRTIELFSEKETALLGASIYLFSPLVFTYGVLGHLASGVVFFVIIVSYFFLKFMRDGDSSDLVLAAFSISIGCLYKREIILMLVICSVFLAGARNKDKDLMLFSSVRVLSSSILSFLPWYLIGTRGADNTAWSHFSEINGLLAYASMLVSQISLPVFSLFLFSIIYVFVYKRNKLTVFFGMVFVTYYCLYTSLLQQGVHRYAMALYPSIGVFLAQFTYSIAQKIRWKYAYNAVSSILILYLVILCMVPRSSTNLITFKYTDFENQSFPFREAFEWVINETRDNEKVLVLMKGWFEYKEMESSLPAGKIYFLHYPELTALVSSGDFDLFRQGLKDLSRKLDISYIMFPGGKAISIYPLKELREVETKKYLEEDKNNDFISVAKFSIDDNYVYVSRLRESFIEKE